ncbi:crotonase/enoyl-CoA hydratase family protein [Nocardioides carbamazepini]|jgi:enoyl-CoA hydratase|uniref:crotonase/enoyl-CoA hydratase family protein n=1 Tax=Nocardioides carbamazepini TaxID=2854259 RepID=UPI002149A8C7|nr:crotonase/enoyl-CoA hydratase family protein [Nocardioides carbamazepini]MCR1786331.1 crotonase/enoyl-CoA hydratase family protein [Nocardioides carbamazepini]
MPDEVITRRPGDGTLVIELNRPQARNAVNENLARLVAAALDELDEDASLQVGIITGAGGTFCSGMDLKAFVRGERPEVPGRGFAGLVERASRKPLIAAVEGYALAGGFEIVLACDLVVAGEGARFGLPEVKRSLVAAGGGLLRLPERIPYHAAMEIGLLGDMVTAGRMERWGLVNRLVPDGEALAEASRLAAALAGNGPLALMATKQVLVEGRDWPMEDAFARQSLIADPVSASADAREGAVAFAEKRAPVWTGR